MSVRVSSSLRRSMSSRSSAAFDCAGLGWTPKRRKVEGAPVFEIHSVFVCSKQPLLLLHTSWVGDINIISKLTGDGGGSLESGYWQCGQCVCCGVRLLSVCECMCVHLQPLDECIYVAQESPVPVVFFNVHPTFYTLRLRVNLEECSSVWPTSFEQ